VEEDKENEPTLGIQEGGLQSAESLLLARYFMFSQVYYHRVRVIYDIHLLDFLKGWLPGGRFNTGVDDILKMTDNEVTVAFREAAFDTSLPGHDAAKRIVLRGHFKRLYTPTPDDLVKNPRAGKAVEAAAKEKFGAENVRYKKIGPKGVVLDFPVETSGGDIVSARALSRTISDTPQATADYVFIEPSMIPRAKQWRDEHLQAIIVPEKEESHETTV
jgi:hypothetical protein